MNNDKMKVTEHLQELRKTVIISAAAIFICSAAVLLFSGKILTFLTDKEGYTFMYTSPEMIAAQQLKISVICGIIISLPVTVTAVWKFICPAMNKKERRMVRLAFGTGLFLFFCGTVFAFAVIFPVMLRFFKSIECAGIEAYISISEYIGFLITVCIIFGAAFELPIVMICLDSAGIVRREKFAEIRKYAVVVIFFVSALITPSDVFSMIITAAPIILIYEAGIAVMRLRNH
ncbi:MAG: twin-arginine translocase subunit TatC [bacterium]|nr:twin-arginine translocase subunit TatC [bacterium]